MQSSKFDWRRRSGNHISSVSRMVGCLPWNVVRSAPKFASWRCPRTVPLSASLITQADRIPVTGPSYSHPWMAQLIHMLSGPLCEIRSTFRPGGDHFHERRDTRASCHIYSFATKHNQARVSYRRVFNGKHPPVETKVCQNADKVVTTPSRQTTSMLAVFCQDGHPLRYSTGYVGGLRSPADPRLWPLIKQVSGAVIPGYDDLRKGDSIRP